MFLITIKFNKGVCTFRNMFEQLQIIIAIILFVIILLSTIYEYFGRQYLYNRYGCDCSPTETIFDRPTDRPTDKLKNRMTNKN
jgi:hypothetical protein